MKNIVVGIDIGGTNTVIGVVDNTGEIIVETSFETQPFKNDKAFSQHLISEIRYLLNDLANVNLLGIGIGAPNANYFSGKIESAPNIPWAKDVSLAAILNKEFNVVVKLTNDANAAALGEMLYGNAKGLTDFILITLGTGLGSGFVSNGKLILGHDGFAGEMGHITAVPGGRLCGCGKQGCLETYVSATGIRTTVLEMMRFLKTDSVLQKYTPKQITSKLIYEAAVDGDKLAKDVFDFTAKILGEKLADVVALTSPQAVFFFGGLSAAGDLLLVPTKNYMEQNLMPIYRNKVSLQQSALIGKNAAVLGAAALIWN
ncbi:MAG: ROK family protein [Bacteroidales bacterium]|nr:ROK family protein [Bacteroidales bacterium]